LRVFDRVVRVSSALWMRWWGLAQGVRARREGGDGVVSGRRGGDGWLGARDAAWMASESCSRAGPAVTGREVGLSRRAPRPDPIRQRTPPDSTRSGAEALNHPMLADVARFGLAALEVGGERYW
jgi:hypothetical protein